MRFSFFNPEKKPDPLDAAIEEDLNQGMDIEPSIPNQALIEKINQLEIETLAPIDSELKKIKTQEEEMKRLLVEIENKKLH